ncbi:uncharacterized protein MONOS_2760 [Monocercomonoides exilis]|uniref:uncharacterized protein n=1 Tax=Monocercomonoides exilis TaxID=2049356 RepID=UPI003559C2FB|nr:hypothetical protein MONOS_2760 [Monocercomonoides exilis]|eukprot:MONOS_2760.1-p1 / transcript=MONOS_2760.1 / gene=MONOS_2760 / organism=Monocercomonoides_exilis_PA203 / gene_product=unspecified product / transcript_product=unspecified product / location=Mono_scaffold00059:14700-25810(-) / protein_length=3337 / sequence_SO=supercontig / SO=protein_coding / is_pseudo=false
MFMGVCGVKKEWIVLHDDNDDYTKPASTPFDRIDDLNRLTDAMQLLDNSTESLVLNGLHEIAAYIRKIRSDMDHIERIQDVIDRGVIIQFETLLLQSESQDILWNTLFLLHEITYGTLKQIECLNRPTLLKSILLCCLDNCFEVRDLAIALAGKLCGCSSLIRKVLNQGLFPFIAGMHVFCLLHPQPDPFSDAATPSPEQVNRMIRIVENQSQLEASRRSWTYLNARTAANLYERKFLHIDENEELAGINAEEESEEESDEYEEEIEFESEPELEEDGDELAENEKDGEKKKKSGTNQKKKETEPKNKTEMMKRQLPKSEIKPISRPFSNTDKHKSEFERGSAGEEDDELILDEGGGSKKGQRVLMGWVLLMLQLRRMDLLDDRKRELEQRRSEAMKMNRKLRRETRKARELYSKIHRSVSQKQFRLDSERDTMCYSSRQDLLALLSAERKQLQLSQQKLMELKKESNKLNLVISGATYKGTGRQQQQKAMQQRQSMRRQSALEAAAKIRNEEEQHAMLREPVLQTFNDVAEYTMALAGCSDLSWRIPSHIDTFQAVAAHLNTLNNLNVTLSPSSFFPINRYQICPEDVTKPEDLLVIPQSEPYPTHEANYEPMSAFEVEMSRHSDAELGLDVASSSLSQVTNFAKMAANKNDHSIKLNNDGEKGKEGELKRRAKSNSGGDAGGKGEFDHKRDFESELDRAIEKQLECELQRELERELARELEKVADLKAEESLKGCSGVTEMKELGGKIGGKMGIKSRWNIREEEEEEEEEREKETKEEVYETSETSYKDVERNAVGGALLVSSLNSFKQVEQLRHTNCSAFLYFVISDAIASTNQYISRNAKKLMDNMTWKNVPHMIPHVSLPFSPEKVTDAFDLLRFISILSRPTASPVAQLRVLHFMMTVTTKSDIHVLSLVSCGMIDALRSLFLRQLFLLTVNTAKSADTSRSYSLTPSQFFASASSSSPFSALTGFSPFQLPSQMNEGSSSKTLLDLRLDVVKNALMVVANLCSKGAGYVSLLIGTTAERAEEDEARKLEMAAEEGRREGEEAAVRLERRKAVIVPNNKLTLKQRMNVLSLLCSVMEQLRREFQREEAERYAADLAKMRKQDEERLMQEGLEIKQLYRIPEVLATSDSSASGVDSSLAKGEEDPLAALRFPERVLPCSRVVPSENAEESFRSYMKRSPFEKKESKDDLNEEMSKLLRKQLEIRMQKQKEKEKEKEKEKDKQKEKEKEKEKDMKIDEELAKEKAISMEQLEELEEEMIGDECVPASVRNEERVFEVLEGRRDLTNDLIMLWDGCDMAERNWMEAEKRRRRVVGRKKKNYYLEEYFDQDEEDLSSDESNQQERPAHLGAVSKMHVPDITTLKKLEFDSDYSDKHVRIESDCDTDNAMADDFYRQTEYSLNVAGGEIGNLLWMRNRIPSVEPEDGLRWFEKDDLSDDEEDFLQSNGIFLPTTFFQSSVQTAIHDAHKSFLTLRVTDKEQGISASSSASSSALPPPPPPPSLPSPSSSTSSSSSVTDTSSSSSDPSNLPSDSEYAQYASTNTANNSNSSSSSGTNTDALSLTALLNATISTPPSRQKRDKVPNLSAMHTSHFGSASIDTAFLSVLLNIVEKGTDEQIDYCVHTCRVLEAISAQLETLIVEEKRMRDRETKMTEDRRAERSRKEECLMHMRRMKASGVPDNVIEAYRQRFEQVEFYLQRCFPSPFSYHSYGTLNNQPATYAPVDPALFKDPVKAARYFDRYAPFGKGYWLHSALNDEVMPGEDYLSDELPFPSPFLSNEEAKDEKTSNSEGSTKETSKSASDMPASPQSGATVPIHGVSSTLPQEFDQSLPFLEARPTPAATANLHLCLRILDDLAERSKKDVAGFAETRYRGEFHSSHAASYVSHYQNVTRKRYLNLLLGLHSKKRRFAREAEKEEKELVDRLNRRRQKQQQEQSQMIFGKQNMRKKAAFTVDSIRNKNYPDTLTPEDYMEIARFNRIQHKRSIILKVMRRESYQAFVLNGMCLSVLFHLYRFDAPDTLIRKAIPNFQLSLDTQLTQQWWMKRGESLDNVFEEQFDEGNMLDWIRIDNETSKSAIASCSLNEQQLHMASERRMKEFNLERDKALITATRRILANEPGLELSEAFLRASIEINETLGGKNLLLSKRNFAFDEDIIKRALRSILCVINHPIRFNAFSGTRIYEFATSLLLCSSTAIQLLALRVMRRAFDGRDIDILRMSMSIPKEEPIPHSIPQTADMNGFLSRFVAGLAPPRVEEEKIDPRVKRLIKPRSLFDIDQEAAIGKSWRLQTSAYPRVPSKGQKEMLMCEDVMRMRGEEYKKQQAKLEAVRANFTRNASRILGSFMSCFYAYYMMNEPKEKAREADQPGNSIYRSDCDSIFAKERRCANNSDPFGCSSDSMSCDNVAFDGSFQSSDVASFLEEFPNAGIPMNSDNLFFSPPSANVNKLIPSPFRPTRRTLLIKARLALKTLQTLANLCLDCEEAVAAVLHEEGDTLSESKKAKEELIRQQLMEKEDISTQNKKNKLRKRKNYTDFDEKVEWVTPLTGWGWMGMKKVTYLKNEQLPLKSLSSSSSSSSSKSSSQKNDNSDTSSVERGLKWIWPYSTYSPPSMHSHVDSSFLSLYSQFPSAKKERSYIAKETVSTKLARSSNLCLLQQICALTLLYSHSKSRIERLRDIEVREREEEEYKSQKVRREFQRCDILRRSKEISSEHAKQKQRKRRLRKQQRKQIAQRYRMEIEDILSRIENGRIEIKSKANATTIRNIISTHLEELELSSSDSVSESDSYSDEEDDGTLDSAARCSSNERGAIFPSSSSSSFRQSHLTDSHIGTNSENCSISSQETYSDMGSSFLDDFDGTFDFDNTESDQFDETKEEDSLLGYVKIGTSVRDGNPDSRRMLQWKQNERKQWYNRWAGRCDAKTLEAEQQEEDDMFEGISYAALMVLLRLAEPENLMSYDQLRTAIENVDSNLLMLRVKMLKGPKKEENEERRGKFGWLALLPQLEPFYHTQQVTQSRVEAAEILVSNGVVYTLCACLNRSCSLNGHNSRWMALIAASALGWIIHALDAAGKEQNRTRSASSSWLANEKKKNQKEIDIEQLLAETSVVKRLLTKEDVLALMEEEGAFNSLALELALLRFSPFFPEPITSATSTTSQKDATEKVFNSNERRDNTCIIPCTINSEESHSTSNSRVGMLKTLSLHLIDIRESFMKMIVEEIKHKKSSKHSKRTNLDTNEKNKQNGNYVENCSEEVTEAHRAAERLTWQIRDLLNAQYLRPAESKKAADEISSELNALSSIAPFPPAPKLDSAEIEPAFLPEFRQECHLLSKRCYCHKYTHLMFYPK